ncbi:hypothetical protein A2U01_0102034, partial [Trifolium medium]|nr:hypothetical protein [Trifolium medium]
RSEVFVEELTYAVMLNGDEICELDIDGCIEEREGVTVDGTKSS